MLVTNDPCRNHCAVRPLCGIRLQVDSQLVSWAQSELRVLSSLAGWDRCIFVVLSCRKRSHLGVQAAPGEQVSPPARQAEQGERIVWVGRQLHAQRRLVAPAGTAPHAARSLGSLQYVYMLFWYTCCFTIRSCSLPSVSCACPARACGASWHCSLDSPDHDLVRTHYPSLSCVLAVGQSMYMLHSFCCSSSPSCPARACAASWHRSRYGLSLLTASILCMAWVLVSADLG